MPWQYQTWLLSNVLSSLFIFILTFDILWLTLWCFPKVFYAMVARMFNIKRSIVDVHHEEVKTNSQVVSSEGKHHDARRVLVRAWKVEQKIKDKILCRADSSSLEAFSTATTHTTTEKTNHQRKHLYASRRNKAPTRASRPVGLWPVQKVLPESKGSSSKQHSVDTVDETHPSHPAYERLILNVYGKYLPLRRKRNRFLILLITSIVIAAVIIAFCEGCLLASSSVYPEGPCPALGDMECYDGTTKAYFECKVGQNIGANSLKFNGVCFRWIARDQSISTLLTQLGVCTGLLVSFGSVTEVFIRLLFLVYQPRRGLGNGIRRALEKTVGINNVTQPACMCCIGFCIRIPPPNLGLYRFPVWVVIVTLGYIFLAVGMVLAYIPLLYFELSVTSYTYIVLVSVALLCFFTLIWVVWEVDDVSRVLPGACETITDILKSSAFQHAVTFVKESTKKFTSSKTSENDASEDKDEHAEEEEEEEQDEDKEQKVDEAIEVVVDTVDTLTDTFAQLKKYLPQFLKPRMSELTKEAIEELQKFTSFDEQEIKEWHAGFMEDCPNGKLNKRRFMKEFEKYFVRGNRAKIFCDYFFETFDNNQMVPKKDGVIEFTEFLIAISSNTQNEWGKQLELAFDIYNTSDSSIENRSGQKTIDEDELTLWVKALYELVDMPHRGWCDTNDPRKTAKEIIRRFDTDGDGQLTKAEFREGCKKHLDLMMLLVPPHRNKPTNNEVPSTRKRNTSHQTALRTFSKDA